MQEGTLGNVRTAMSGLACIDKKTGNPSDLREWCRVF